jgi:agmatinase
MHYAKRIVQVGVRSVAQEEMRLCNGDKVKTHFAMQTRDFARAIPRIVDQLGELVYLSVDLSVFDPSVVPCSGNPLPGGLGWYDVLDLIREVARRKSIVSADITELTPMPHQSVSELAAARLAYKIIGYVAARKTGQFGAGRSPRTARVK